ncbi:probable ATP-dependent RNA helicase ddx56 isoform X2 [Solanum tuberosum]|uniref:probable ATP-dependent RNA helicase ddx56 isoform X2 n=1 Tax=Solanum tuberosum TaxID=4113 RepID=UPI00073A2DC8|nr:PREDICTED: probable ATP-dependent RNA helicase ddx56 isoform X2 [Solanum tuberosum]
MGSEMKGVVTLSHYATNIYDTHDHHNLFQAPLISVGFEICLYQTYCEIIFVTLVQFPLGWLVFSPGYILRLQFDDSRCSFERKYLVKGDSIGLQRYISSFVFSNLKNVKIVIFSGVCLKEHTKKLFKLSNFLLKNTVVLEKFVIVSNRQRCEICGIKCMPRFLSRLANKLGSSADSVIIFQQHVDVSSVVNPKDKSDQDSDDNEEDSYGEDHQYSDDEEESCSDYFQDSDYDQDSYSDYYEDSDDMEEDNPDEDSDDMEEDKQ